LRARIVSPSGRWSTRECQGSKERRSITSATRRPRGEPVSC